MYKTSQVDTYILLISLVKKRTEGKCVLDEQEEFMPGPTNPGYNYF